MAAVTSICLKLLMTDTVSSITRMPPVAPRLVSQPPVIAAVMLFDLGAIIAAGGVTHRLGHLSSEGDFRYAIVAAFGVAAMAVAILAKRWAYTIRRLSSLTQQAVHVGLALAVSLSIYVISSVLIDPLAVPQKSWLLSWIICAWAFCLTSRFVAAALISRWACEGRLGRRAVIVGGGDPAHELIHKLERTRSGIQILGLFDDRGAVRSPEQVGRYQKLGRFEDMEKFCRAQRVDLLIIALPATAEDRILDMLKMLWALPIDIRIAALGSKLKLRKRSYDYIGEVPFLPVFDKPMADWSVALKLVEDRLLAGMMILLLSPLLTVIAIAIKLDSRGPVLFRQTRYGFNNEKISVYKFRSMYVDQTDEDGVKSVTRDDRRVTRFGRFLRRTSLDELPQLFNVAFRGDLSLVGPRPHALQSRVGADLFEEVVDGYFARHRVKPGITGWAQIKGWRGGADTREKIEQRVAHDLFYIDNWSIGLDLRILLLTPLSLITTKEAY